jgi:phosphoribosylformylglycinamidine synthase
VRRFLIWLDEIQECDAVDRTCGLFSESAGRFLVSVGREDDVNSVGLCEARSTPVLRIGVPDNRGELEIQDVANLELAYLRGAHETTLAEPFV